MSQLKLQLLFNEVCFLLKKKKQVMKYIQFIVYQKKIIEREWFTFKGEMNTRSNWNSSVPSKKYAVGHVHLVDRLNVFYLSVIYNFYWSVSDN
jgi:hypothetical protein